ncbi:hypothetical protein ABZU45_12480 [Streptomyces avermitilis]|uniref:hypothetical protein n=1 Tax=Streptomyces avermitilis TaxID=33903 RepID=UPI0033A18850
MGAGDGPDGGEAEAEALGLWQRRERGGPNPCAREAACGREPGHRRRKEIAGGEIIGRKIAGRKWDIVIDARGLLSAVLVIAVSVADFVAGTILVVTRAPGPDTTEGPAHCAGPSGLSSGDRI